MDGTVVSRVLHSFLPLAIIYIQYILPSRSLCYHNLIVFFFFSSRRRHTRSLCDWSSDVCSSDLHSRIDRFANPRNDVKFIIDNWYLILIALASGVMLLLPLVRGAGGGSLTAAQEIGRASCRERV